METKQQNKPSKLPDKVKDRRKKALAMWKENIPLKTIAMELGMKSRGGAYGLIKEAKRLNLWVL